MESKQIIMADLHASNEALIQYAYQRLGPKHFDVEVYCNTLLLRLAASRYCLNNVRATLEHSAELGENEIQILLVKESEAAIFHAGSALEAFGQLLNLSLGLGLPEGGRKGASFAMAKGNVLSRFPKAPIGRILSSADMCSFVDELKAVRDQITHRRLLDYRARVLGTGVWMPSVLVGQTEQPLVPFLERLIVLTEKRMQDCAEALVASLH